MLFWLSTEHWLDRSCPRPLALYVAAPQHQDLSLQSVMVDICIHFWVLGVKDGYPTPRTYIRKY